MIGALGSLGLLTTKDPETFARAGVLIVLGLAFWAVNSWLARGGRRTQAAIDDQAVSADPRRANDAAPHAGTSHRSAGSATH